MFLFKKMRLAQREREGRGDEDGDIHDLQQEEDAGREKVLREMALRVVRFRNEEVMKNLSAVVGKINKLIAC